MTATRCPSADRHVCLRWHAGCVSAGQEAAMSVRQALANAAPDVPRLPGAQQAGRAARQAAHEASPWLVGLGRFGYVAKGTVYLIVGGLAAEAALGHGGATTDSKG